MKLKLWTLFILVITISSICAAAETGNTSKPGLTDLCIEDLMNIEIDTISTASRYMQKVTEAPSSVSIITASQIEQYGYRTMADIMRYFRDFYVTHDQNYDYIGGRGFSRPGDFGTRYLFMIDGHRLNDPVYDGYGVGRHFILDVDIIDRVEVVRGSGSSLYGSNAFFGVVNVITKLGQEYNGPEISGAAGSHDSYDSRLSYGNKFENGLEMLFSGSYYESDGDGHLFYKEFNTPENNYGASENNDDERSEKYFARLSLRGLTLQGAFVSRRKTIPTASYATVFNDSGTRTKEERGYLSLKYNHNFSEFLDVESRIFYDYYDSDGRYVYDWSEDDVPYLVTNEDYARGGRFGGEFKISKTLFEKHRVIFGGVYRNDFKQDQKNYDLESYLDSKEESKMWALYFQGEFSIRENLLLNFGLRYDDYDHFGSTLNPRIAMIYNPFEHTTLKGIFGTAFRIPNVYETSYAFPFEQKANQNLDPEKIETYELILEQNLKNGFYFTGTGFFNRVYDLIAHQLDPADGLFVFNNMDEIQTKGIGLEFGRNMENGIDGKVSYTLQETEDQETGRILTNSPKHLAKLNVTLPLIEDKLFIGIEEQFTSKRKTLERSHTDGFFVTNLTLFSRNLTEGLKISGSVYNLFDKEYDDPGSSEHLQDEIEQDGRLFRIKLTFGF